MDHRRMLHFGLLAVLIFINEAAKSPAELFMEGLSSSGTDNLEKLNEFFKRNFLSKPEYKKRRGQFVAAALLQVEKIPHDSRTLFWTNSPWKEYEKTKDCSPQCEERLKHLTTRGTSNDILPETTIHTELKMLYGEKGRTQLMEPAKAKANSHIVVMYTTSVPCSQLRCKIGKKAAYYAECAGDLKNYRHANKADGISNPMIITIYSGVFKTCQNNHRPDIGEDRTNEKVSNLYLKIGGIPSFKLTFEDKKPKLQLQNRGFENNINNPSDQIFPRLTYAMQFGENSRFVKCIVEDHNILSEIIPFQAAYIALDRAKTGLEEHYYKEVLYRILIYIFIKTPAEDQSTLLDEHVGWNKGKYDVCKEYKESYFDVVNKNDPFHENHIENNESAEKDKRAEAYKLAFCKTIIIRDISFIKRKLWTHEDDRQKIASSEARCKEIMSRQRPIIVHNQ